jgi:hypothetical protein
MSFVQETVPFWLDMNAARMTLSWCLGGLVSSADL